MNVGELREELAAYSRGTLVMVKIVDLDGDIEAFPSLVYLSLRERSDSVIVIECE
jgi:hypothetical protein